ncbi:hypothetical protein [Alcaligenes sp. SDU_A2]|uniref:hypothetical protein n=1 Tax=Alcaligenes sp. SDU_A2 TaxID=3136634 RepID=UPI00311E08E8
MGMDGEPVMGVLLFWTVVLLAATRHMVSRQIAYFPDGVKGGIQKNEKTRKNCEK